MYLKLIILILVLLYMLFLKGKYRVVGSDEYNKARKKLAVFTAILLILQSGLRHVGVGPDTYQYQIHFVEETKWSLNDVLLNFIDVYQLGIGKDAGYALFEKLFSMISCDYQVYLVFVAALFFIPLVIVIYKNTNHMEDIVLSVIMYFALFYHFFSITGIRQTVATSFCLIAYNFVERKKIIPFLLFVLCGSMIHKTALIFIPFYWIANIKRTNTVFVISMCLFPIMLVMGYQFTSQLALFSGSDHYIGYADEGSRGAYNLIGFYLLVALITFWKYHKVQLFLEYHSGVFNAVYFGLSLLPLSFNSPNLIRLSYYYLIYILMFLGYINNLKYGNNSKIATYLLVGILIYKIILTGDKYAFYWEYFNPLIS